MAEEKWYQKSSVQAAMVSGVFAVVLAVIGFFKEQAPSEPQNNGKASAPVPVQVQHPEATGAPNFDSRFSPKSLAARQALRGVLRRIAAAESGLRIDLAPPGTFAFAHPVLFRNADFQVDRIPNGRLSFEIHKVALDQVYAVVFVSADTQRQIELDSKLLAPATLYTDMWLDAPYAVRLNVASCRGDSRIVRPDEGGSVIAVDCSPLRKKR